jgi:hypothetical protein
MKFIIPIIVACSSLFSYDSYVDCQLTANPYDLRGQTRVDIIAPHVIYHTGGSFVFSPEVSTYTNSNTDLGFSIAKKHQVGDFVVGSHLFYDRSGLKGATFHHTGGGIYLGCDVFEVTANYYHPLTKDKITRSLGSLVEGFMPRSFRKSCKWIDSEFLLKSPWFKVGTGIIYNVAYNETALHSRFIIPTERCTLSVGGIMGQSGFSQGFVSISFSLSKNPSSSLLSTPIGRCKKNSVSFFNLAPANTRALMRYTKQNEELVALPVVFH